MSSLALLMDFKVERVCQVLQDIRTQKGGQSGTEINVMDAET